MRPVATPTLSSMTAWSSAGGSGISRPHQNDDRGRYYLAEHLLDVLGHFVTNDACTNASDNRDQDGKTARRRQC